MKKIMIIILTTIFVICPYNLIEFINEKKQISKLEEYNSNNQNENYIYQSKNKFYLFNVTKTTTYNNKINLNSNKKNTSKNNVILLRAGGGTSGGGSGGSSSGRHSSQNGGSSEPASITERILGFIVFLIISFSTVIIFYLKVIRASINSKRLLKILDDKDKSWNYRNIETQVIKTFYSVQESWTNMDMTSSKEYMDYDLYEKFTTKLEWMQMGNRRNILKKIRLVNLKPISIYDDEDNSKDLIWFYIKGKMIDYIIDTETNEKIEGNDYSIVFVEFWKFVKKDDKWVLAKILQQDEGDLIKFQDN